MKLLFCHDGPLSKDESGIYYGIAHNDRAFVRYFTIASKVHIAIRVKYGMSVALKSSMYALTLQNLSVMECPNISSLRGQLTQNRKINAILRQEVEEADYVVCRLPSMIGNVAFDICQKSKKPCLVEVVGCPWDALWNHSLKGKLMAPYMTMITRRNVKRATHALYVTNKFLQHRYPTDGKQIGCSNVTLTEIDETILSQRLEQISHSHKKIILGTTAAVNVRYKGQQYVITALGMLKKQGNTQYEYHLVGGGDQSYLKEIAAKHDVSEQVKFLGSLPHDQVFSWLDSLDIYVQPSQQEGLPRAVVEAMSRALPCIGSNVGGIPELLDEAFMFSYKKPDTKKISQLLLQMSSAVMEEQAKRNFKVAQQYDSRILEDRRAKFFQSFADDVRER